MMQSEEAINPQTITRGNQHQLPVQQCCRQHMTHSTPPTEWLHHFLSKWQPWPISSRTTCGSSSSRHRWWWWASNKLQILLAMHMEELVCTLMVCLPFQLIITLTQVLFEEQNIFHSTRRKTWRYIFYFFLDRCVPYKLCSAAESRMNLLMIS